MGTRGEWARDFAAALGNSAPSAATVRWISAWTAQEDTKAAYNPLATTHVAGGATAFNSAGVKNFPTRAVGIAATVSSIRGDHPGYSDIVYGITANKPEVAQAGLYIAPWGSNGRSVDNIYRATSRNVEDEPLKSEAGAAGAATDRAVPATASPTPMGDDSGWGDGGGGGGDWTISPDEAQEAATRISKVIVGVVMIGIAINIAIKAYVPSGGA